MDTNDRDAIAGLFDKLAEVERRMPARDAEAEHLIAASIARQPGAPYYLAQTVVVQEHALNVARLRIEALEADLSEARRGSQGGGFLSGLFGDTPAPRRRGHPAQPLAQGASGGFLAGAAQTAMGVAGGMMLASALGGMFAGEATAAEMPDDTEADLGDAGFGDDSSW
jgi:hypothetical protein